MKLLTLRQWLGPSRYARNTNQEANAVPPREEIVGLGTRLPLAEALASLRAYEESYAKRFRYMAVNFNLVAVSEIDDLDSEALEHGRVHLIEDLLSAAKEDLADAQKATPRRESPSERQ